MKKQKFTVEFEIESFNGLTQKLILDDLKRLIGKRGYEISKVLEIKEKRS